MKLQGLTIWQRQMLVVIVGRTSGTSAVLRKADKALNVLEFSPEEADEVGLEILPNGDITWSPTAENTYDLEIKDKEAANHVKRMVEAFGNWQYADKQRVFDLEEKLGITPKEDDDA